MWGVLPPVYGFRRFPEGIRIRTRPELRAYSVRPVSRFLSWYLGVGRFGEVARSSAAWSWRWCRAGPGFPSSRLNRVSGRSSKVAAPGAVCAPRRASDSRWHALLSRDKSQSRKPAQHKSGFLPDEGRNPVEQALSNKQATPRWRRSCTGDGPTCLPKVRDQPLPRRSPA